ncbi:hypothetical protein CVT26_011879 [Gymnopilus dilepis]|uniref:Uncharacterized protein n=1 Tax=Gymnopilus dilepis TaxID=231916 RepID=A0A409W5I2_9AGAR|nr:hypothetical protein CVT26_011879 [Gymnopilus dilepis]
MTTIRHGMISTTFDTGVPDLSLDTLECEYSQAGSDHDLQSTASPLPSSSTTQKAVPLEERTNPSPFERCFITKQPGYHLKKFHWVNAVRRDKQLKYEVVSTLDATRVVPCLDRNLHYALDTLSLFAVTCSKETFKSLIALVDTENENWQARWDNCMTGNTRCFALAQPPFSNATYELVLLHPRHFLQMQKGSAVTAFTDNGDGDGLSRQTYFVSPDGALREGPEDSKPRFPAFSFSPNVNRARAQDHAPEFETTLNPFLVVLNAGTAFRRFMQQSGVQPHPPPPPPPLCAEYRELVDLTLELVDKIYFRPLVKLASARFTEAQARYSSVYEAHDGNSNLSRGATAIESTRKVKDLARNSRTGRVLEEPGPGAEVVEVVEYREYLMSGCDYMDDDTDEDENDEDDGSDDEYDSEYDRTQETLLTGLHIVRIDFSLDEASNLTPLDRNLHYALDKLSFFAVTCSKEALKSMIALVDAENKNLQAGHNIRSFSLFEPPFSDATYELVLLHPRHFFRKGSALTAFTEDGDQLVGKMYFVSPDGALREGPDDSKPRFPAFPPDRARASEDMLNPFLVVLNAGIAFRRFMRQPRRLCAEYMELINLTLELVDLIYYKPVVEAVRKKLQRFHAAFGTDSSGDITISKAADEFGSHNLGRNSRTGRVVKEPGPGASYEELIEYQEYLMSGCVSSHLSYPQQVLMLMMRLRRTSSRRFSSGKSRLRNCANMAAIRHGMVSIALKYSKVPGVPEFQLEALEHDSECSDSDHELMSTASASSESVGSTKAVQERTKTGALARCFITKQTGYHLKKFHWINTVRKDKISEFNVETLLTGLHCIVRIDFSLEEASNLTPLDRNLHYALDKLSFFAVTCSKETLKSMIALVDTENKNWQAQRNKGQRVYARSFVFLEPPFSDATYELVLLHPRHFLQKKGSALTAFTEDGERLLVGKMYFVSPDGALREGPDDSKPRFPAFPPNRARASEDMLNPFLVVLNAGIAFRRFMRRPRQLCPEYAELINLTLELVDLIYFKPVVEAVRKKLQRFHAAFGIDSRGDSTVSEAADAFGSRNLGRNSRTGRVVKEPGPGASYEEVIQYQEYLMSGCDYIDEEDNDDDDFDDESEEEEDNDDDTW